MNENTFATLYKFRGAVLPSSRIVLLNSGMGACSYPSPNSTNGLYRASLMANDSARESFLMCSAVPSHKTAAAGALGKWAPHRTKLVATTELVEARGAVVEGKTSQPQGGFAARPSRGGSKNSPATAHLRAPSLENLAHEVTERKKGESRDSDKSQPRYMQVDFDFEKPASSSLITNHDVCTAPDGVEHEEILVVASAVRGSGGRRSAGSPWSGAQRRRRPPANWI